MPSPWDAGPGAAELQLGIRVLEWPALGTPSSSSASTRAGIFPTTLK